MKIKNKAKFTDYWIRAPSPTFSGTLSPESWYARDIFVWLPDKMHGIKLPCVSCKQSKNVEAKEWPRPIGRRVITEDSCYYLISRRMECKACKITFLGHDRRVIQLLPKYIQQDFPAWLSPRSGIDLKLLAMLRTCFSESMGPEPFARFLRENHTRRYHDSWLQYLNIFRDRNSRGGVQSWLQGSLKDFSRFEDKHGYNGFFPSSRYLRDVFVQYSSYIRPFLDRQIMKRDAEQLAADHSFKVCFIKFHSCFMKF